MLNRCKMLVVTTETINGKNLEMLGTVKGSTIQTVNAFKDIGSGLKTLVGGELGNYNEMMIKARTIATDRMIKEADDLGADAVVGLRYSTSSIMQSAAEVIGKMMRYNYMNRRSFWVIVVMLVTVILSGCTLGEQQVMDGDGMFQIFEYRQISQEEAKQMMEKDDGHVIVDVRREDEYAQGHIPGAILIPNES
nr:heavy metal-binding domain-containing protein [Lachnospiraceae bacterium]